MRVSAWRNLLGGLAAALACAGGAWAQSPDIELRSSTWIESNYPEFARNFQLHGDAVLSCLPAAQRKLTCKVVSESPSGLGFGAAALDVAWGARLKPGVAAKGPIAFPVTFAPTPILDRPLRQGDPSANALQVMTLLTSGFVTRRMVEDMWTDYLAVEVVGLEKLSPAMRAAAQAAVQDLKPRLTPTALRALARELDARSPPEDLAAVVAFLTSDAGRDLPVQMAKAADIPRAAGRGRRPGLVRRTARTAAGVQPGGGGHTAVGGTGHGAGGRGDPGRTHRRVPGQAVCARHLSSG